MRRSRLRIGLLIAGIVLVGAGAVLAAISAGAAGFELIGAGLILIAALAVESWRYKRLSAEPPGPGWTTTGERFVDPETGRTVTVFFHEASGERRYVVLGEGKVAGRPS